MELDKHSPFQDQVKGAMRFALRMNNICLHLHFVVFLASYPRRLAFTWPTLSAAARYSADIAPVFSLGAHGCSKSPRHYVAHHGKIVGTAIQTSIATVALIAVEESPISLLDQRASWHISRGYTHTCQPSG